MRCTITLRKCVTLFKKYLRVIKKKPAWLSSMVRNATQNKVVALNTQISVQKKNITTYQVRRGQFVEGLRTNWLIQSVSNISMSTVTGWFGPLPWLAGQRDFACCRPYSSAEAVCVVRMSSREECQRNKAKSGDHARGSISSLNAKCSGECSFSSLPNRCTELEH